MQKQPKIILSGGGTGGSVAPLLAVAQKLQIEKKDWNLIWIGTKHGLEKKMAQEVGLQYIGICSGKWRRYFSLKNLGDIFKILVAFIQSLFLLAKLKPQLVMSAGGFVSVPLAWAAYVLGIKVIIHQQDLRSGLANRLMAPVAKKVTVTFSKSLKDYGTKAILTGNPVRQEFVNLSKKEEVLSNFDLQAQLPIITVVGGGSGAVAINTLIDELLPQLTDKYQVVHIRGDKQDSNQKTLSNYHTFSFLPAVKIAQVLSVSDLVISRCGLGFITELSYLTKTVIFIPMPNSHQEDNAKIIEDNQAGLVLQQNSLDANKLLQYINDLMSNLKKRQYLADNLQNLINQSATDKLIELIKTYVKD